MAEKPIGEEENVLAKYHRQKFLEDLKKNIKDMLPGADIEFVGLGEPGRPIAKSFPMRPEWQKTFDDLEATRIKHEQIEKKHRWEKEFFWALVHKDTEDARSMRYNPKTKEIEVFEEKTDDDAHLHA